MQSPDPQCAAQRSGCPKDPWKAASEPESRAGTENLEDGTEKEGLTHLLFPRTQVYKGTKAERRQEGFY